MLYYYAPSFTEIDGDMDGAISPGKDTGGGVESAVNEIPGGCKNLKYDAGAARFVLRQSDSYSPLPGWTVKTKAEVNADYPGLVP